MENEQPKDASTPANGPASGQPSLADQILAMKAERDAKLKAMREEGILPGNTDSKPAEPQQNTETPSASGNEQPHEPAAPLAGAPEAGGPAQTEPEAAPVQAAQEQPQATPEPEPADVEDSPASEMESKPEELAMVTGGTIVTTDEAPAAPFAEPVTEDQPNPEAMTPEKEEAGAEADTPKATDPMPREEITAPEEAAPARAAEAVEEPVASETAAPVSADQDEHEEEHEEHIDHDDTDFTVMSKDDLAREIKRLTSATEAAPQGRKINEAYRQFQHRLRDDRNEALARFTATGGEEADFTWQPSAEDAGVEKMVQQYRENKNRNARLQEEVKAKNLQAKKELLERLRHLVDSSETQNSMEELKHIQGEWKSLGAVPQGESQELWNTYHALLDKFYNNRTIYNELKDLDRKKNLEAKVALCERAEALAKEDSINKALLELRHLHEEWKNVGPVPAESREPIWERFIAASEAVHQRRKEYLNERKAQEDTNLISKIDVLGMIENFGSFVTDRINEWRSKTDEIQKLKEIWEKIGLVPKEKAEEINKRFWGAYKTFFNNKNAFFKALDDQKMENLRLKTQMCELAESLKDSDDYEGTKEQLIQLQKKWKTIGRVPDKQSDEIWNRFRAACNAFFDKRTAEAAAKEAAIEQRVAEKRAFVNELEQRMASGEQASREGLEALVSQWKEKGSEEGRAHQKVEEKFYQLAEQYVRQIEGLSEEEQQDMIFQMEVASLKANTDNSQQLQQKEQTLRKEIQTLEHSISTLKTNMDFFAKSKNADQIRQDYTQRIDESQRKINELKRKLKLFRKQ